MTVVVSDHSSRPAKRVLLVGWDGADWGIAESLIRAGRMPHLAKLISRGARGTLTARRPLLSPVIWTNIATGRGPWAHGLHGHTEPRPSGWGARPVGSYSRTCPSVWDVLGGCGLRCHVIGWPATHPVGILAGGGISVSDRFALSAAGVGGPIDFARAVNSAEWLDRLASLRLSPADIDPVALTEFIPCASQSEEPALRKHVDTCAMILAEAATLHAAATAVLADGGVWDFAAVWYPGIERFSHGFMAYHPPIRTGIPAREFDLLRQVVTQAYVFHDMMLGRLLELAGPETTVMLVSDHGFHHNQLRPPADWSGGVIPSPEALAAWHRPQGMLVVSGPGIRTGNGNTLGAACRDVDVAPTLLTLLGVPIDSAMAGRPWRDALAPGVEPDFVLAGEMRYPTPAALDEVEEASVATVAHLAALGYREPADAEMASHAEHARLVNAMNLAEAMIDSRRVEHAIEILEPLVGQTSQSARVRRLLAEALFRAGRDDEARVLIEELLRRGDDAPLAHAGLGMMELAAGKTEAALRHFRESESRNPQLPGVQTLIGSAYAFARRWEDAERALRQAIAIDSCDAEALAVLAGVRLELGDAEAATELARQSLELNAGSAKAHFQLGRALQKLGRVAEANDALQACIHFDPDHLGAHRHLADLFAGPLWDERAARRHRARVEEIRIWRRARRRSDEWD